MEFRKVRTKVAKWEFSSTGYLAFGLSQCLAEDYVDRPQPLAPALAARMRSRLWDRAEKKLRCLLAVRRANLPLNREYVLARIVETQIDLKPEERERYRQLAQEQGKEVQKMVITWEDALAERWAAGLAEGEAKGLAEGEAKGLAEGEAKGKREATRQAIGLLAKHHHGSLPAGFEEKIAAIDDLSRLYEILEQVTEVRFLEELDLSP